VTDQTISANSTPASSLRVVVDSADAQLPDFVLRGGSTMTFNIETFEDSGGADQDMRGRTITVSFYTTGSVLISTLTVVAP
jgi:hypothetical protein